MPNNGVYVRLPPGPRAWLDGLSDAAGVSRADVVSDALGVLVATVWGSPDGSGLSAIIGSKYGGFVPGKEKSNG